jgi:hypothetical protein
LHLFKWSEDLRGAAVVKKEIWTTISRILQRLERLERVEVLRLENGEEHEERMINQHGNGRHAREEGQN